MRRSDDRKFHGQPRGDARSMKTRTLLASLVVGAVGLATAQGCASSFETRKSQAHLVLELKTGNRGTADGRNPLSFDTPARFTVKITAIRADGAVDDAFEGWVRFSSKPGTVISGSGDDKSVRNAQLHAGVADDVAISILGAYGDTRLWAEDLG